MTEHGGAYIRSVKCTDFKSLTEFFQANNRSKIRKYFHPFPFNEQEAYRIACTEHDDRFYIASLREQIVGFCMLRGWDAGYKVPSFGVFVGYQHQGGGLGRSLTEFAISEAKIIGAPGVRLSVYASNQRAVHLYTSLGFVVISREPVFLEGVNDERIVMLKEL